MLENSCGSIFLFFSAVTKIKMSFEAYGSFRAEFLHDKKGKLLKSDSLFLNIYNFWTILNEVPISMKCERWYHPKVAKLERVLRKK